jgi:hypothetical protein
VLIGAWLIHRLSWAIHLNTDMPQHECLTGPTPLTYQAGDGKNAQGGHGGAISLQAGAGHGQAAFGGDIGDGGDLKLAAGGSLEGTGGAVSLKGGSSQSGECVVSAGLCSS